MATLQATCAAVAVDGRPVGPVAIAVDEDKIIKAR